MDFAQGARASSILALAAVLAAAAVVPALASGEGNVTRASRFASSAPPATFHEAAAEEEAFDPIGEPVGEYLGDGGACCEEQCGDAGCGCDDCFDCCKWSGDHWYVSVSGGWQDRERVHEISDDTTFLTFDGGFSVNGALGREFDSFRLEFEATLMNNEVETAGSGGLSSTTPGNINVRAYMFNVYHDVHIECSRWSPYLSGGIGLAQSAINGMYPGFFNVIGPPFEGTALNCTSDWVFAWQLRAGTSYHLTPRTDLTLGYRYFHADDLTFSAAPFVGPGAPTFVPNGSTNHCIELGIRVKF